MAARIVIPARTDSTRLPNKPLLKIHGKEVLCRIVDRAQLTGFSVCVLAGDEKIIDFCEKQCIPFINAIGDFRNGTERASLTNACLDDAIIIWQCDELTLQPSTIQRLVRKFKERQEKHVLTAMYEKFHYIDDINTVKIALSNDNRAIYFSRNSIPYNQFDNLLTFHCGLYITDFASILDYKKYGQTTLEHVENLEQLRWLQMQYKIYASIIPSKQCFSINTPYDYNVACSMSPDFFDTIE